MTAPSLPEVLPPIPNKRYFTIGEVGVLCDVKAHVLRYWEQEFGQLKPTKRQGNRRYYQRHDIELIRQIRRLLYDQGFTIAGARLQLTQGRNPAASTVSSSTDLAEPALNWDLLSREAAIEIIEPRIEAFPPAANSSQVEPPVREAVQNLADIRVALDALADEIALSLAESPAE